jgi:hypothetical protein
MIVNARSVVLWLFGEALVPHVLGSSTVLIFAVHD